MTQEQLFISTQHGEQPTTRREPVNMSAGDFPVATLPLSRPDDPQTSLDAAADLSGSGTLGEAQLIALKLVLLFPGENAAELERLTQGEAARSTHKRLRELARTGWLLNAGTKTDPKTGKQGLRWWPSKKALAWAKTRHVASATGAVLSSVLLAAALVACGPTKANVSQAPPPTAACLDLLEQRTHATDQSDRWWLAMMIAEACK